MQREAHEAHEPQEAGIHRGVEQNYARHNHHSTSHSTPHTAPHTTRAERPRPCKAHRIAPRRRPTGVGAYRPASNTPHPRSRGLRGRGDGRSTRLCGGRRFALRQSTPHHRGGDGAGIRAHLPPPRQTTQRVWPTVVSFSLQRYKLRCSLPIPRCGYFSQNLAHAHYARAREAKLATAVGIFIRKKV